MRLVYLLNMLSSLNKDIIIIIIIIAGHGRDVNNMYQHYYLYVLCQNEKSITLILNLKIYFLQL